MPVDGLNESALVVRWHRALKTVVKSVAWLELCSMTMTFYYTIDHPVCSSYAPLNCVTSTAQLDFMSL